MLKLSEIGKLSQQFTKTCCYKNLRSHLLATQKCIPASSNVSTTRHPNQAIRVQQRAGLCQLASKNNQCCANCNEINQSIWAAMKKTGCYVPDTATSWYERQRDSRLNRHSLLEQCKCNGISSFVPPEECFKYQLRACMAPLDARQYKRISPEFLKILQNYEYLTALYDPARHRNGYQGKGPSLYTDVSTTNSKQTSKCKSVKEEKTVSEPLKSVRYANSKEQKPSEPTSYFGHPRAHGYNSIDKEDDEEQEKKKNTSPKRVIDAKKQPSKNEDVKTTSKKKPQTADKKEPNLRRKPEKKASVRELWTKPNASEMRESGGSIEVKRTKGKLQSNAASESDSFDGVTKFRPQLHRQEYSTYTYDLPQQSRGRRGKILKKRSSATLKKRSGSTKKHNSPVDLKPRVHGLSDSIENTKAKKRNWKKPFHIRNLWSSRSPSTDRAERPHSLHRKPSVTEMNPTVHGYSKHRLLELNRSAASKSKRKRSPSSSPIRISSDRDDDSDVPRNPRTPKVRTLNYQHKPNNLGFYKHSTAPSSTFLSANAKSRTKSPAKKENIASLGPSVNAYKQNQRVTKRTSAHSPSTVPDATSSSRKKFTRLHHTGANAEQSTISTFRGRPTKREISSSASEVSMSPRLHGYRQQGPIKSTKHQVHSLSPSAPTRRQTRKIHSRSPSYSDSLRSEKMSQSCSCAPGRVKNRESVKKPTHQKATTRHHSSPKRIEEERSNSVRRNKPTFTRPGLHGYRHHELAVEDKDSKKGKNYSAPSSKHDQTKTRPELHSMPRTKLHSLQLSPKYSIGKIKPNPQQHTTIAAFTTNISYNPDKGQDLFYECNKSSSSPLESDSSCPLTSKLKNKMNYRSKSSSIKFSDSDRDDPRLQKLHKIHCYQDIQPEDPYPEPTPIFSEYINSNSIVRKCFPTNPSQSETALSSECEERVIRFAVPCDNTADQPCSLPEESATYMDQVANSKKDPTALYHCSVLCECSKLNCDDINGRRDSNASRSTQDRRRSSEKSTAPRYDTSPNTKRHSHCYGDSRDWHHADEQFPTRYREARQKAEEEEEQLEEHKQRNKAKSRLYSLPSSEESFQRHQACARDSIDWTNVNENYPARYQQAARDARAEQEWREKHRKKTSTANDSPVAEERHIICASDGSDWVEVTENYPARYQEVAARQEAEKRMLEKHTEKLHSKSSESQPGVSENYPLHYRIAALENASGKKVHTSSNIKGSKQGQSFGPGSSTEPKTKRNVTIRKRNSRTNKNKSPVDRSRTPSPADMKPNVNDKDYRPHLHGLVHNDQLGKKRSTNDHKRKRAPERNKAQEKPREKSPATSKNDEDQPQHRFRLSASGYYKSPTYLQNPNESRIPISVRYAQDQESEISAKDRKPEKKEKKKKRKVEKYKPLGPDYVLGKPLRR